MKILHLSKKKLVPLLGLFLVCLLFQASPNFESKMETFLSSSEGQLEISSILKRYGEKQIMATSDAHRSEEEEIDAILDNLFVLPARKGQSRGAENGSIEIVEFSSLQCPYSKRANKIITKLIEKNPTKVRHVFRHFPLPTHTYAKTASRFALAAGERGKFWHMIDALFSQQHDLTAKAYPTVAQAISVDYESLEKSYKNDYLRYDEVIREQWKQIVI